MCPLQPVCLHPQASFAITHDFRSGHAPLKIHFGLQAFGGTQPERAGRIWQEHCLEEMNNLK